MSRYSSPTSLYTTTRRIALTHYMKNLLHLGEDRYLTTLLLEHFPLFKTQFIRDAHAYTMAPDDWKVLLSQRRC